MAQNIPARPVIGGDNGHGGPNTQYDLNDWDKIYGAPGSTSNPDSSVNQASTMQLAGDANAQAGEAAGRNNASIYYGNAGDIGASAADYRNKIAAKVGQASGLANQMTQSANQQIDRSSAKAGMSGIDNTAQKIGAQRDAQTRSNTAQQAQDQVNLSNYGKSIGAGISGTESLAAAGAGRGTASTPTPTPSYGGGIFGSLGGVIATRLFYKRKITAEELRNILTQARAMNRKTYRAYLILAQPILKIENDYFLDNIIKPMMVSYGNKKPNLLARIFMSMCFIGGLIYSISPIEIHVKLYRKALRSHASMFGGL